MNWEKYRLKGNIINEINDAGIVQAEESCLCILGREHGFY